MLTELLDPKFEASLRRRLIRRAWRRYRIPTDPAQDVFQDSWAALLEALPRYGSDCRPVAVLTTIFWKKCATWIERQCRWRRRLAEILEHLDALHPGHAHLTDGEPAEPSVLEELVQNEDSRTILLVLRELRPESRQILLDLATTPGGRQALIERLGVNKNTLDSRLHAARTELREHLARHGIHI